MIEPGKMTIGEKRLEYLDFGNKALIGGNYNEVEQSIKSFLKTIRTGSQIAKEINDAFNDIENKKKASFKKQVEDTEAMDLQTREEVRYNSLQQLHLMSIDDRLDACWQIMMKYKMHLPTSD